MDIDDAQGARDAAFDARQYVLLARGGHLSVAEGIPSADEVAAWCVILERAFKWLKDDEQATAFSKQLETMPASAVENARRILRVKNAGVRSPTRTDVKRSTGERSTLAPESAH